MVLQAAETYTAVRGNRRDVHRVDRDRFKTEIDERGIEQSLHME